MKKTNILLALIACISLMGCKGNTISESSSSEESSEPEPERKIVLSLSMAGASMFKDVTYEFDYSFFYEDDWEWIPDYKPVAVSCTDSSIAVGSADNYGRFTVHSIETGQCVFTLVCEEYNCSAELPVTVGPYGLLGVTILDAPTTMHVNEEYTFHFKTEPEEYMTQLTPYMLYCDSPDLMETQSSSCTLIALGPGLVHVTFAISIRNPSYDIGPTGATAEFDVEIVE